MTHLFAAVDGVCRATCPRPPLSSTPAPRLHRPHTTQSQSAASPRLEPPSSPVPCRTMRPVQASPLQRSNSRVMERGANGAPNQLAKEEEAEKTANSFLSWSENLHSELSVLLSYCSPLLYTHHWFLFLGVSSLLIRRQAGLANSLSVLHCTYVRYMADPASQLPSRPFSTEPVNGREEGRGGGALGEL